VGVTRKNSTKNLAATPYLPWRQKHPPGTRVGQPLSPHPCRSQEHSLGRPANPSQGLRSVRSHASSGTWGDVTRSRRSRLKSSTPRPWLRRAARMALTTGSTTDQGHAVQWPAARRLSGRVRKTPLESSAPCTNDPAHLAYAFRGVQKSLVFRTLFAYGAGQGGFTSWARTSGLRSTSGSARTGRA
jgi:hypothetical protein